MEQAGAKLVSQIRLALNGERVNSGELAQEPFDVSSLEIAEKAAWIQLQNWIEDQPLITAHPDVRDYCVRRLQHFCETL